MRRKNLIALTLSATAILALAGCTAAPGYAGTWEGSGKQAPSLEIEDGGAFSGNDGCNTLMGEGVVEGEAFNFGQFASTRKLCEDVDTWLSLASSATVDGDTLTVLDRDGDKIGTLKRK